MELLQQVETELSAEKQKVDSLFEQLSTNPNHSLIQAKAQLYSQKQLKAFVQHVVDTEDLPGTDFCNKCQELETECLNLFEELKTKEELVLNLKQENSKLTQETLNQQNTYEEDIADLKNSLEGAQLRNQELKKDLSTCYGKLEESLSKTEDLREHTGVLEERNRNLEEELDSLKKTLMHKDKVINSLEKEITERAEDFNLEKNEEVKELSVKNSILQKALKTYESQVEELKQELDNSAEASKEESVKHEAKLNKLEQEKKLLQDSLNTLKEQLSHKEETHSMNNEQVIKAKAELQEEMATRIFELQQQKLELEQQLQDYKDDPANPDLGSLHDELSELGDYFSPNRLSLGQRLSFEGREELEKRLMEAQQQIIEAKLRYAEAEMEKDAMKVSKRSGKVEEQPKKRSFWKRIFKRRS